MTKSAMLDAARQHPSVTQISDERSSGDGVWLYLSPGWLTDDGMGCIHEDTVTAAISEHKRVHYDPYRWYQRLIWAYPDSIGLLPAG